MNLHESNGKRGLLPKGLLLALAVGVLGTPFRAAAELPDTATLLGDLGLSPAEIAQVEAGQLVRHTVRAASDRELTTAMAFQVSVPPGRLIESARESLLYQVNPDMIAWGTLEGPAKAADFAKLELKPEQVKAYLAAKPGGDLNLSQEEIATFEKLGADASAKVVTDAVRTALAARVEAYRTRGLDGIAPYARDGHDRSPAEEFRIATKAGKLMAKYAPEAHALLLSYPKGKPPGTEEVFRWSQIEAHGVPTISLDQLLLIPDGDAWILVKRQFYVSTGYNTEQSTAAFLPSKAGTVMVYATRTSTDQVTGFGGSAKRSIGSRLLASQLETMFEKARAKVQ
jgi:hypothetical protein